jgi:hypothetical protein
MAVTIKQTEAAPDSYPASGLSPEPANANVIWQRLESYIAYRWSARVVTWVVEGPGEWCPPLEPAVISTVEVWSCGAEDWDDVTVNASPLGGYWLSATGPFRFVAVVGEDDAIVPETVLEAFVRLSEYLDAVKHRPGLRSASAGSVSVDYRDEMAMAQALQRSGAADLLRPFRRAA